MQRAKRGFQPAIRCIYPTKRWHRFIHSIDTKLDLSDASQILSRLGEMTAKQSELYKLASNSPEQEISSARIQIAEEIAELVQKCETMDTLRAPTQEELQSLLSTIELFQELDLTAHFLFALLKNRFIPSLSKCSLPTLIRILLCLQKEGFTDQLENEVSYHMVSTQILRKPLEDFNAEQIITVLRSLRLAPFSKAKISNIGQIIRYIRCVSMHQILSTKDKIFLLETLGYMEDQRLRDKSTPGKFMVEHVVYSNQLVEDIYFSLDGEIDADCLQSLCRGLTSLRIPFRRIYNKVAIAWIIRAKIHKEKFNKTLCEKLWEIGYSKTNIRACILASQAIINPKSLDSLNFQDFYFTVIALSAAGWNDKSAIQKAFSLFMERKDYNLIDSRQLCLMISAFGEAKVTTPEFFDKVEERIDMLLRGIPPSPEQPRPLMFDHMAKAISGYEGTGQDPQRLETVFRNLLSHPDYKTEMTIHLFKIPHYARALTKWQLMDHTLPSFQAAVPTLSIQNNLKRLTHQDIYDVLCGFHAFGIKDLPMYSTIAHEIDRRAMMYAFTQKQIYDICVILVDCKVSNPRVFVHAFWAYEHSLRYDRHVDAGDEIHIKFCQLLRRNRQNGIWMPKDITYKAKFLQKMVEAGTARAYFDSLNKRNG